MEKVPKIIIKQETVGACNFAVFNKINIKCVKYLPCNYFISQIILFDMTSLVLMIGVEVGGRCGF